MTRLDHSPRSAAVLTMANMRHLIAPIVGVAAVAVLGIGAHSVAATNQSPSTASSASPRVQDEPRSDNPESDGPGARSAHAAQMVAIARAHRAGMKHWQRCTAAAGASNRSAAKCSKPLPAGWVKHTNKHARERSPGHGKSDEAHGD